MINRFLFVLLTVVAAGLVLSGCGGEKPVADQFTADLVQSAGGLSVSGKFFARAGNYRMDLEEGGQPLCVIVDMQVGTSTISAPLEKMFTEIPVDHPASITNDPFQGLRYLVGRGESQPEGSEIIEGYSCDKSVIIAEGKKAVTRWVSTKLNFPIKIVMHGTTEKTIELKNILEVAVADSLFQLSADYARFELPGQKPVAAPDWADRIPASPLKQPPFTLELAAGDIIRIEAAEAKSLAAKAECLGEGSCAVYAIPFKGGLPLREISSYIDFAEPGTLCTRLHETTAEADEYVIRVAEGSVKLETKWLPMYERRLKAGEELRVPLVPGQNVEDVRFVNLNEGPSACSWKYYSEGKLLGDEVVGPAEYRSRALRTKYESQRSVWRPFGDEIVVKVDSGEMLVKLGQFDALKF